MGWVASNVRLPSLQKDVSLPKSAMTSLNVTSTVSVNKQLNRLALTLYNPVWLTTIFSVVSPVFQTKLDPPIPTS